MDDADAESALFARLYPSLRRFAAVTDATDVDPDDLVQEAVARAIRIRPLTALDDPAAYLRRTIVNLAKNRRRGLARARLALGRLSNEARTEAEYSSDLTDLQRLGPVARAVLFLVEVEGWTYAAASQQLGMTGQAARTCASRARRRLRLEMEEEL